MVAASYIRGACQGGHPAHPTATTPCRSCERPTPTNRRGCWSLEGRGVVHDNQSADVGRTTGGRVWARPLDRVWAASRGVMARPAGAAKRKNSEGGPSKRAPTMVFANTLSYGHVRRTLKPPSRRTSPSLDDTDDPLVVPDDDTTNADANESEAATLDGRAGMVRTSDPLSKVEYASEQALITLGMLKESALADTVRRLSELEDVPLGDAYGLRDRARTLAERWRETFGDGLLS
ncbi:hypothetical protein EDB92DRAFT_2024319 [Lactarius akahatsu]|uniref:Uncharacterized protein n=1 Tax=Lactarius akahatsu TaxID=416441 RepID=A0AAD4QB09_9AGAM|nr:hypothetical protein EDB92DRAFT_2024319 [Lactarius akahatsu]